MEQVSPYEDIVGKVLFVPKCYIIPNDINVHLEKEPNEPFLSTYTRELLRNGGMDSS